MYKVTGREVIRGRRYAKFKVLFSTTWPSSAKTLYLVSTFTSMFPGRIEMKKVGSKGIVEVLLWDGEYPYLFSLNARELLLDDENPSTIIFGQIGWGSNVKASRALVGVEEYEAALKGRREWYDLVIHDERSPVFFSVINDSTIIRLHSPRGIFDEVILHYKSGGGWKELLMEIVGEDKLKSYYEVVVEDKVAAYRFMLKMNGRAIAFGDGGVGVEAPIDPAWHAFSGEGWWIGALIYSIFVDSFAKLREPPGVKTITKLVPREPGFYGGSLEGILQYISHLENLGVDAVYLTPIYPSPSYHRYDVIDHLAVDPLLGGEKAFKKLVEALDKRGIRVILELVAHHTSPCNREFLSTIMEGSSLAGSMYRFLVQSIEEADKTLIELLEEYIRSECKELPEPMAKIKPFYEAFFGLWSMPKLDHSREKTREYIKRVISKWLRLGVKGFRVDVGHALPDRFLKEYYDFLKRTSSEAFLASEISVGLEHYPLGITMDSATNYDLRDAILRFAVTQEYDSEDLVGFIARQYSRIPFYSALSNMNLLGSHDTPRVRTLARECYPRCLKIAYALLFALPGAPTIYYGDEIGMEGGGDPDNRRPMEWNTSKWDLDLLSFIKKLSSLRKRLRALRYGSLKLASPSRDSVSIVRSYRGETVWIYVNRAKEELLDIGEEFEVHIGRRVNASIYSSIDGLLIKSNLATKFNI